MRPDARHVPRSAFALFQNVPSSVRSLARDATARSSLTDFVRGPAGHGASRSDRSGRLVREWTFDEITCTPGATRPLRRWLVAAGHVTPASRFDTSPAGRSRDRARIRRPVPVARVVCESAGVRPARRRGGNPPSRRSNRYVRPHIIRHSTSGVGVGASAGYPPAAFVPHSRFCRDYVPRSAYRDRAAMFEAKRNQKMVYYSEFILEG